MPSPSYGHVSLPCPHCGRAWVLEGETAPGPRACPRCSRTIVLAGGPALTGAAPPVCVVCGSALLYWQKDFDQRLGCALVALGAALVPWTFGLSLAFMALVDFVLFRIVPKVSVCYVCRARYRGVPPHPDHAPYDLMTAQTYEARSVRWADRPEPGR